MQSHWKPSVAYLRCANRHSHSVASRVYFWTRRNRTIFRPVLLLMKTRKGQKKKSNTRKVSPAWECETGSLPTESEEPTLANSRSSDEHAIQVDTTSSQLPVADDTASEDSTATVRQHGNAKHAHWQPWQDRFLALEAFKLQPFGEESGKEVDVAWDRLAVVMLEDSQHVGNRSIIDRTGPACKARFRKLVETHKVRNFCLCCTSFANPNSLDRETSPSPCKRQVQMRISTSLLRYAFTLSVLRPILTRERP